MKATTSRPRFLNLPKWWWIDLNFRGSGTYKQKNCPIRAITSALLGWNSTKFDEISKILGGISIGWNQYKIPWTYLTFYYYLSYLILSYLFLW
jgi:hypothetical protein